jgi:hypothetical protein
LIPAQLITEYFTTGGVIDKVTALTKEVAGLKSDLANIDHMLRTLINSRH